MRKHFILVVVLGALLGGCGSEPALLRQAEKVALAQELRGDLLVSVEAEKSAVMAVTDEESAAFAREAQERAAAMERLRDELRGRVVAGGRDGELQALAAFDAAWDELRDVDARLLALAVANSNLKAAQLAAGESAAAVDRLVDALAAIGSQSSDARVLRALSAAAVSALRIQTLLAPHIASPDDAEMTRLEERVRRLGEEVGTVLDEARAAAPSQARGRVAEAEAAWADYQRLLAEVLRLSRLNTNVLSVDVSLHEKRHVTGSCLDALSALIAAIESAPKPTR